MRHAAGPGGSCSPHPGLVPGMHSGGCGVQTILQYLPEWPSKFKAKPEYLAKLCFKIKGGKVLPSMYETLGSISILRGGEGDGRGGKERVRHQTIAVAVSKALGS